MSTKTLTRAGLVEAVARNVGLPRSEAVELVEMVLRELSSALARGEQVKLSSFGSFGIRDKRERIGRNPKTGEEVPITPRRVLVFRASNIMKKRIDETIKKANGKSVSAAGKKAAGKSGKGTSSKSASRRAGARGRSAGTRKNQAKGGQAKREQAGGSQARVSKAKVSKSASSSKGAKAGRAGSSSASKSKTKSPARKRKASAGKGEK